MSEVTNPSPAPKGGSKSIPDGIAKGIIGFVLGAGVMFLVMHFYGPREKIDYVPPPPDQPQFFGIGGPPAAGPAAAPDSAAASPPQAAANGEPADAPKPATDESATTEN